MANAENPEALAQLKAALESKNKLNPTRHDDNLLYRFLRARKFDVAKAEIMITEMEEWREKEKVDDIVKNFAFTELVKISVIYPRFYHKTDKLGRTIYIEILKNIDMNKLYEITTQERMITHHIRESEKFVNYRLPACSAKKQTHIGQGFSIMDFKGVPLSQFNSVRKVIQLLTAISSNNYPETLGRMFFINTPTLFTAVWSVIKNFLDENTVAKITILGSNYSKQLLEHVDAENLPKFLGGTCECPGGCENSDTGPWNDGTVPGYPMALYEDFKIRDKGEMSASRSKELVN